MAGTEKPILRITGLDVHYGAAQALHGVNLTLTRGILSVIGRNGMGKTTLCDTIMGMKRPSRGDISFAGQSIAALPAYEIQRLGIGYVPQGRRTWPSLTVDEHLRLPQCRPGAAWTRERAYDVFPRLAERRSNGGDALSGGEKQMLAIARALIGDPRLLIMDEPTEGLAPVIVDQVAALLVRLAEEEGLTVLLIEQNFAVATRVAPQVAVMVNGHIEAVVDSVVLAADEAMKQQLLGVGRRELRDDAEPILAEAAT
jgi:ABC-type branched-subunit amino acid transport system ATPase component